MFKPTWLVHSSCSGSSSGYFGWKSGVDVTVERVRDCSMTPHDQHEDTSTQFSFICCFSYVAWPPLFGIHVFPESPEWFCGFKKKKKSSGRDEIAILSEPPLQPNCSQTQRSEFGKKTKQKNLSNVVSPSTTQESLVGKLDEKRGLRHRWILFYCLMSFPLAVWSLRSISSAVIHWEVFTMQGHIWQRMPSEACVWKNSRP